MKEELETIVMARVLSNTTKSKEISLADKNNPAWFENFKLFFTLSQDREDELFTLIFFSGMCNKWIDKNLIKGNERNELVAKEACKMYFEVLDWKMIKPKQEDGAMFENVRQTAMRLYGLSK
jgi:hypothetical protein